MNIVAWKSTFLSPFADESPKIGFIWRFILRKPDVPKNSKHTLFGSNASNLFVEAVDAGNNLIQEILKVFSDIPTPLS